MELLKLMCAAIWSIIGQAGSPADGIQVAVHSYTKESSFQFIPYEQCQSESFGMVMGCPAHAHGTPEDGMKVLMELLQARSKDTPSAIWVCRSNQQETLEQFAPVVDRVVINPFVSGGAAYNRDLPATCWANCDHPVLNRLRNLRRGAGDSALYACIDLGGDPSAFSKRRPSFDELQWMTYAVIGAGFQGIVWRSNSTEEEIVGERVRDLEYRIESQLEGIEPAKCLGIHVDSPGMFVSVLRHESLVFCIILSPAYLSDFGSAKHPTLPLEEPTVELKFALPLLGRPDVASSQTLSRSPLTLRVDDERIHVGCTVSGPGDIIVLRLLEEPRVPAAGTPTPQPQPES